MYSFTFDWAAVRKQFPLASSLVRLNPFKDWPVSVLNTQTKLYSFSPLILGKTRLFCLSLPLTVDNRQQKIRSNIIASNITVCQGRACGCPKQNFIIHGYAKLQCRADHWLCHPVKSNSIYIAPFMQNCNARCLILQWKYTEKQCSNNKHYTGKW